LKKRGEKSPSFLFEKVGCPESWAETNIPPTLLLVARRATVNIGRLTACNHTALEGGNSEDTPSKICKTPREENKKLSCHKIGDVKYIFEKRKLG